MNDLPVIEDLVMRKRFWDRRGWGGGGGGGNYCKSLERNLWRKFVSSAKAVILDKE